MTYAVQLIVLAALFIASVIWMVVRKGDRKIFTGKTIKLGIFIFIFSHFISGLALLHNQPKDILSGPALWLVLLLIYGLFTWWYAYKRQLGSLDMQALLQWEFPRVSALAFLGCFCLLNGLWAAEVPAYQTEAGMMSWISATPLCLALPFLVVYAYKRWNEIPKIIEFKEPWVLPVDKSAPVIEPSGRALRLFFFIPAKENEQDYIQFDVRVPHDTTLADVFHHLLHQHNVQKRSPKQISIARENKKEFLYGWLLYRVRKKWWWRYRDYLDLYSMVKFSDLDSEEQVFAERVPIWEKKYQAS